jgi:predicted 2-oxoglutarate/Fe(II)-dependent dioxygenase YbiX
MSDQVNHPSHYNSGKIEVIDAIEDWKLDFHAGNVVKYVARHQHKLNPVEDLKKARWYLDRLIQLSEKKEELYNAETRQS